MDPETQTLGRHAPVAVQSQQCRLNGTLLSISQTALLSGVSVADLLGLVEHGVLTSTAPDKAPHTFDIGCVIKLQRASLMRQDLALDSHGLALAVMFLNQITGLEEQLHSMQRDPRGSQGLGTASASQTQ